MADPTTLDVIRATPPDIGRCRAKDCGRLIEWVRVAATGKILPVNHPLIVTDARERLDGVLLTTIEASRTHWVTCPAAASVKRPAKGKRTKTRGGLLLP